MTSPEMRIRDYAERKLPRWFTFGPSSGGVQGIYLVERRLVWYTQTESLATTIDREESVAAFLSRSHPAEMERIVAEIRALVGA